MTTAAQALAAFATDLKYEQIPAEVIERAKLCMVDTVAAVTFGAGLPWSRILAGHVRANSAAGHSSVVGAGFRVCAPGAALANGAAAHAFELDSMCQPSVGSHPGAGLTSPGLAVAQALGRSGRELLTAFVAGSEVMYRIGDAGHHTSEQLGFHAPGLLGVFGGAVTAGLLMELDAGCLANALGVGGSMCSGLLEFSKSGGGMVKRLHLGRAAESAVTAASLARDGFTGPAAVIEGKYGFLNVYCRDADATRLTAGLGETWHTMKITLKRYPCHSTAHVAVTAALEIKNRHGVSGADIETITIAGSEKMASHHNIVEPRDIAMAQYSAPFCVALAFYRNPRDPGVYTEETVQDAAIRALCRKVKMEVRPESTGVNQLTTRITVRLKDGRELTQELEHYPGMPRQPLDRAGMREKFDLLMAALPKERADRIFAQFTELETVADVGKLALE